MQPQPIFSLTIPTLGKVEQLGLTIRSVLEQNFSDFEIIAIDSGPAKESAPLIQSLNDKRIQYVNTEGQDPRLNWDVGFEHSKGQYIMWIDDDNYLLPHELSTLAEMVRESNADVVAGFHVHWRDLAYPIKRGRNQLIIREDLFDHRKRYLNPQNVIRMILGLPYEGEKIRTRFHHTEHAIRREIIEKLRNKMGKIDWGSTSTHALRIGTMALAKSIYYFDVPLCIVGQYGESMTFRWPKDSSQIKHATYTFRLSPVKGKTYTNYVHENHLLIKHFLPKELADFEIDSGKFIKDVYIHDLVFLNEPWPVLWRHWTDLYRLSWTESDQKFTGLKGKIIFYSLIGLLIKILRSLKLLPILQKLFISRRLPQKGNIILTLDKYEVKNIRDCAQKLPEIIKKEIPEISKFFPQETTA